MWNECVCGCACWRFSCVAHANSVVPFGTMTVKLSDSDCGSLRSLHLFICMVFLQEVNSLQWEVSFNQAQMKRSQQSWEQKYSRLPANTTMSLQLESHVYC